MSAFDSYLMVDWSAANAPTLGHDSIWLGLTVRWPSGLALAKLENLPTRAEATARIIDLAGRELTRGRRLLIGFDFPFGFPAGTAARLGLRGLAWRNLWQTLEDRIADGKDNRNNRFDVAESLNREMTGEAFPFWGLAREEQRAHLARRNRRPHGPGDLAERRECDVRIPSAQPVWKLAGAGCVGGQALTGIPRVWQIRKAPELAFDCHIWPFETGLLYDPKPAIIIAEVYPSLVTPSNLKGRPKDAKQVATISRAFGKLDNAGALAPLFEGDPALRSETRRTIETEEAWILGVAERNLLATG